MKNLFLPALKEFCLQALFPAVCPVCGGLLKLSKKRYRIFLTDEPVTNSIREIRSLMICNDCVETLPFATEPRCIRCSRPLESEEKLYCDLCEKRTSFFDSGSALFLHNDIARKVIYDLKFHNLRDNARFLGFEMAIRFHEEILRWNPQVCIPVPLHKKRFRERGFNQAHLIAGWLSFWLEKLFCFRLPTDPDYLLRTENTRPQRTLDSSMRADNVKSAFSVIRNVSCSGGYRSVLLVDDIFTSGATINACAGTLRANGTEKIFFLTASIV